MANKNRFESLQSEDERRLHAFFLGLPETTTWSEINAEYNEMGRQAEESVSGCCVSRFGRRNSK